MDYFLTADGNKKAVHPNVFHRLIDMLPTNGWQVVQESGKLRLLLSGLPPGLTTTTLVASLKQELQSQGIVAPIIIVEPVSRIPKGASGKAPLIKSAPN